VEIILNGQAKEIPDPSSLADLVSSLGLPAHRLAIEHNLKIVKRERWKQQYLSPGDKVEIVHFVGGGEN
jgi:thiamine biosynthesis protein ThiS